MTWKNWEYDISIEVFRIAEVVMEPSYVQDQIK